MAEILLSLRVESPKAPTHYLPNPPPNPRVKVHADQEVGFTIKTPYGRSHATGKISWVTPDETGETFGVEFTHLSEQKDDPLRLLMDSPLC